MIGAHVQPMPLVGAEIGRINDAFQKVSLELSAVLSALRDVEIDGVGTPSCDQAVVGGMTDLRGALAGLDHTATECATALGRHGDVLEGTPVADPGTVDAGEHP